MKNKRFYLIVKRILDLFLSFALICFLALPMCFIALIIRLSSHGPAIFKQIRIGKNGRTFVCYKFRTMYTSAPPCLPSSEFTNAQKFITPFGRFLRRSSLDELPQLFNVLKGNMSIVGPRPLVISERSIHEARAKNGVYYLRPGITGLSQINGRNKISNDEKLELDTLYLHSFSFAQDLKILTKTLTRVISGDGITRADKL